jgi:hypothetical protein
MPSAGGELEQELTRLVRVLRDATNRLEPMAREMVDADADFKVAYAKAYLVAGGPIPEREAKASVDTDDAYRKKLLAGELLRVQKAKVEAVRDAISAVQSLNANARYLSGLESS